MATLHATKWSNILGFGGGIVLGVIGWNRADRIKNSEDIVKKPITSIKVILGLEEPEALEKKGSKEVKGKHTAKIATERSEQTEVQALP